MSLQLVGILLHGFGPRYDLPISRWLYFLAAGFVFFYCAGPRKETACATTSGFFRMRL